MATVDDAVVDDDDDEDHHHHHYHRVLLKLLQQAPSPFQDWAPSTVASLASPCSAHPCRGSRRIARWTPSGRSAYPGLRGFGSASRQLPASHCSRWLCTRGETVCARPAGTMAWVCGSCGESNWITKRHCRACGQHQALWTAPVQPVVVPGRQTYAQAASRGASKGKGGKGKDKPSPAGPFVAVPAPPPAPPLTPAEPPVEPLIGSKAWRQQKRLLLQCKESMLATALLYDARSVGRL